MPDPKPKARLRRRAKDGELRSRVLLITCTEAELALLHEAAAGLGWATATWARGLLLRQAQRAVAGLAEELTLPPVVDPADEIEAAIRTALAQIPRQSDRQIAAQLGVRADRVWRLRGQLGIAPSRRQPPWQDRIHAEWAPGRSAAEIAERTGWTENTVRNRLSQLGLSLRPDTPWQDRLREAWAPGRSAAEIAERTGWTVGTVRTRLSQLGLSLRSPRTPSDR